MRPELLGVPSARLLGAKMKRRHSLITVAHTFAQRTSNDECHDRLWVLMPALLYTSFVGVKADGQRTCADVDDALAESVTHVSLVHGAPRLAEMEEVMMISISRENGWALRSRRPAIAEGASSIASRARSMLPVASTTAELCHDPVDRLGELMLFMVLERFRTPGAIEVYRRARDQGRMLPDGVSYVSSWVDIDFTQCFQLMEAESAKALDPWIAAWYDLVEFEVILVRKSADASAEIATRL